MAWENGTKFGAHLAGLRNRGGVDGQGREHHRRARSRFVAANGHTGTRSKRGKGSENTPAGREFGRVDLQSASRGQAGKACEGKQTKDLQATERRVALSAEAIVRIAPVVPKPCTVTRQTCDRGWP
jgi:hypothetical protein